MQVLGSLTVGRDIWNKDRPSSRGLMSRDPGTPVYILRAQLWYLLRYLGQDACKSMGAAAS